MKKRQPAKVRVLGVVLDERTWQDLADTYEALHGEKQLGPYSTTHDVFVEGLVWGAGWAFALIAMAEAIRTRPGSLWMN